MNITHLKYAVEVARTGSITRAAENLYISQPSLSRAIRELEESLGLSIFKRTAKGIVPTPEGEAFLSQADKIVDSIDRLEERYRTTSPDSVFFSLSAPRSSYIGLSVAKLAAEAPPEKKLEINYKETNSMRTILNVVQDNFRLGIVRYHDVYESHFLTVFQDRELHAEAVLSFAYQALLSKKNPLAEMDAVPREALADSIQIVHGDPFVPSVPNLRTREDSIYSVSRRRISIYDRATQYQLLGTLPDAFMLCAPIPKSELPESLVQRPMSGLTRRAKDALVYPKGTRLTPVELRFIEILKEEAGRLQA